MSTAFEKRLATLAQAQCNYLRTIGGNESDSVGMKEVRLDADGLVKNPAGLYISVIETLL